MGLIDQFNRLLGRKQPDAVTTTTDELPQPVRLNAFADLFRAEYDRMTVVRKAREMAKIDPRIKRVLGTLARDAVRGGFTLKVKNNPSAQQVADDLLKRIELPDRLDDWVKLTLRDGDSFLENSLSASNEIVAVTRKPTLEMRRNSDDSDRFADPTRAFWWADESWWGSEPPIDAVWFAQWQVIHARWDHDDESRYGQPLFGASTSAFKRVQEGETDIAVRRKTRAGMKYLHVIEGGDASAIKKYREDNKDSLGNPFAAVADFFTNKPGSITSIAGDANLKDIEDVMHHIRTLWTASPVPMSLIGYGQDLNRDVLDKQKEQYDEELEPITQWVEKEFVKPILDLQWLLAGILPEGLDYEVAWARKNKVSAADLLAVSDAVLRLRTIGVADEAVTALLQKFLPGVELGTLLPSEAAQLAGANAGL